MSNFVQVLLWSYPDVDQGPLALQTEHAANIFGIQFMPCTNNRQLVTGAMDDTVILHHIDRMPTHQSRRRHGAATPVLCQSTLYGCHRARVKVGCLFVSFQRMKLRQAVYAFEV